MSVGSVNTLASAGQRVGSLFFLTSFNPIPPSLICPPTLSEWQSLETISCVGLGVHSTVRGPWRPSRHGAPCTVAAGVSAVIMPQPRLRNPFSLHSGACGEVGTRQGLLARSPSAGFGRAHSLPRPAGSSVTRSGAALMGIGGPSVWLPTSCISVNGENTFLVGCSGSRKHGARGLACRECSGKRSRVSESWVISLTRRGRREAAGRASHRPSSWQPLPQARPQKGPHRNSRLFPRSSGEPQLPPPPLPSSPCLCTFFAEICCAVVTRISKGPWPREQRDSSALEGLFIHPPGPDRLQTAALCLQKPEREDRRGRPSAGLAPASVRAHPACQETVKPHPGCPLKMKHVVFLFQVMRWYFYHLYFDKFRFTETLQKHSHLLIWIP